MKPDLLHTMIRVKDLNRSVKFYTEVLGLRETARKVLDRADATLVFLSDDAGHHDIELTFNHDGRDYDLGNQFGHFAVGVPDIDAAAEDLRQHGIEFSRGPYAVIKGGSRIAFIEDPDGIEIELIER